MQADSLPAESPGKPNQHTSVVSNYYTPHQTNLAQSELANQLSKAQPGNVTTVNSANTRKHLEPVSPPWGARGMCFRLWEWVVLSSSTHDFAIRLGRLDCLKKIAEELIHWFKSLPLTPRDSSPTNNQEMLPVFSLLRWPCENTTDWVVKQQKFIF